MISKKRIREFGPSLKCGTLVITGESPVTVDLAGGGRDIPKKTIVIIIERKIYDSESRSKKCEFYTVLIPRIGIGVVNLEYCDEIIEDSELTT